MRKLICLMMALLTCLSLAACSASDRGVPVEQVQMIMNAMYAEDRYAGMVVSENVTKVYKDAKMTVQEVYVEEGDEVTEGQRLFAYDGDALRLQLDREFLDMEKLKNEQGNNKTQIKDLKDLLSETEDESSKTQLKIQISTLENTQKQLEYDIRDKDKSIHNLQEAIQNALVTSPVSGTVRKVGGESDSDPYIIIQKSGAYRVKGKLNEMNMGGGIAAGARVEILSRIDDTQSWHGTVSSIDMETAETTEQTDGWPGMNQNPMASSSSYTFYVDLDDTTGLLLGQHVYVRLDSEENTAAGICLPQPYFVNLTTNEETMEMTALVYTVNAENRLETREVTVGAYNEENNTYEILSGLSAEEYVADPTLPECRAGAEVRFLKESDLTGAEDSTEPDASGETVTEEADGSADGEEIQKETAEEAENDFTA